MKKSEAKSYPIGAILLSKPKEKKNEIIKAP